MHYFNQGIEEIARQLESNPEKGLSGGSAQKRLLEYGPNQLKEKKGISPFSIFIEQFKDFIVWVLIVAALVSGFVGEWIDALAILVIVVINAILGFLQEYRAEKSLSALKKLSSPNSKVIRDGKLIVIPSAEIVPGDLVEIEAGDNVPADGRLVYTTLNFMTQEASLTGESTPVMKITDKLDNEKVPLAERTNMVYMGTFVSAGRARFLVADTGMKTELGKIAGMIQEIEEEAIPLQKKVEEFGKWIVYVCFVLVGMVFLLEAFRGGPIIDAFMTSISLAVAAIPEGLPAVVTIALAMGVQRMVKRHTLIRKLPSVETLGSTTVICSDKTGTLTRNEMTVQGVFSGGNSFHVTGIGYGTKGDFKVGEETIAVKDFPVLEKTLLCGVLCNNAGLLDSSIAGDPTEGALLVAAAKSGILKEELGKKFTFVAEIPFDSERKKMSVIYKEGEKYFLFVKGAPDLLLNDCSWIEGGVTKEAILAENTRLTGAAMRVLGFAYKQMDKMPEKSSYASLENALTFLGLMGMIDPPREEVKTAVALCARAGIKTVMITGDHKNTAEAIGRELGISSVYARVSPEDKIRIVKELRAQGEIVAMTGDGVNDAPAIKEADIGIAMGITGTDVTKEVADMVITDDNFASIVAAVEEGRGIYDNIKKFIHFLLSCNAGEILVMFISSLAGLPVPLLPIQILWVNLVTDGLPALALGVDPVSKDVMRRPPRPCKEKIVTKEQSLMIVLQGVFIAACTLGAFVYILFVEKGSLGAARTAAFVVLSVSQLFHAFNCRSNNESILFKLGIFSNLNLVLAVLVSFLIQVSVIYIPFFRGIFKTELLSLFDWTLVIIISSLPLWFMEIVKIYVRKRLVKA